MLVMTKLVQLEKEIVTLIDLCLFTSMDMDVHQSHPSLTDNKWLECHRVPLAICMYHCTTETSLLKTHYAQLLYTEAADKISFK